MEKLKNYILNGKGMGLLFLLASAVVMAVVSMFIFRSIYQDVKPSVILVAQDVLPVTIKNKEIVEPQNMYKKLSINIDEESNKNGIDVILDTRDDVKYDRKEEGIYITKNSVFITINNETKDIPLLDGVVDVEKFETWLDGYVSIIGIMLSIVVICFIFVYTFIKTVVVMLIGMLCIKFSKIENKLVLTNEQLMRLGAVIVVVFQCINLILTFGLNIYVKDLIYNLLMLGCVVYSVINLMKNNQLNN